MSLATYPRTCDAPAHRPGARSRSVGELKTNPVAPGYVQGNLASSRRAGRRLLRFAAQPNPADAGILRPRRSRGCARRQPDRVARPATLRVSAGEVVDDLQDARPLADDLVTFVLGCSFSFENALVEAASNCAI